MMDINVDLLQWFKNLLIKKFLAAVLKMRICQTSNQQKHYTDQLLENLTIEKSIIFYRQYLVTDLADMQLISKFNKGICFLLFVIDIFCKYAWVTPLKDKRVLQIPMLSKNLKRILSSRR